ncbi:MAG TPA: AAA family ATPase [Deltaproteobacteria bacterium]|nr:AAA family ATPase [Deltaproteobacteria bacterium]
MIKAGNYLNNLKGMKKKIFLTFLAFPDFFSVNWLSGISEISPSNFVTIILQLVQKHWIIPDDATEGHYRWSHKFPRGQFIETIPQEEMSFYYRQSADILRQHLPGADDRLLKIAHQYLLAGIQVDDLDVLYQAAVREENNHRIPSAIKLYECILDFIENYIADAKSELTDKIWKIFISTMEHRASLSMFHPDLKKINRFLNIALDTALYLDDKRSQASIHLLNGQNYWMSFQHKKAVQHFDLGWNMIKKMNDDSLYKRGLQLQGLSFWIKGMLCEAIQAYEESLGKLDCFTKDDFSLLTGLNLSLCYAQIGMPQRGLGIAETIETQSQKNGNGPLTCFALATAGLIFLEIGKIKNARTYLERAFELAIQERIPMAEVMAGTGLADIECLAGNFDKASEYFKSLWKLRKSSWYHTLNSSHVFEAGYLLHIHGKSPVELNSVIEFIYGMTQKNMNPFLYGMTRKYQILILEKNTPAVEKIKELIKIEKSFQTCGAKLERAKIEIELARLLFQVNRWHDAKRYAQLAWKFMKPIAPDLFPSDLECLIPHDDLTENDRIVDIIIDMGEALTNQGTLEQLLTKIIMSISRLTGAERSALFIKDKHSSDIHMVASRNLVNDQIMESNFKNTYLTIKSAANGNDDKILQYKTASQNSDDFRYVIITPMKLQDKIIGVLYQDSRFFSFDLNPTRINLLLALASQIAVSIDRAQAYDEIANLNKKLVLENRYYIEEKEEFRPFGEIIGTSKAIVKLQQLIHKVAPTSSTVLIHGETGVGKELVARAIHRESSRHQGPFIRVNCAALPDTLIDSELFGHEKGAFTGAVKTKAGRFELANEGTIFLDEVSELPLSTQSRLLRILQEKEFQRVGGTMTLTSDFRLITASNKDLKKEVADGRFRADLFYRLNVFPIHVVPLRERKDDIPLLARHFLQRSCSQYNLHYSDIPDSEMNKLTSYSWPGNIRELSNMIERAIILGGPTISFTELNRKASSFITDEALKIKTDEVPSLRDVEKMYIMKVLKRTSWKIAGEDGAAVLLGLKRTTLLYRMKKLGIYIEKNMAVDQQAMPYQRE